MIEELNDMPAGGVAETLGYCVAGDRLHLITLGTGTTSAAPLVIGDMVGTRVNP